MAGLGVRQEQGRQVQQGGDITHQHCNTGQRPRRACFCSRRSPARSARVDARRCSEAHLRRQRQGATRCAEGCRGEKTHKRVRAWRVAADSGKGEAEGAISDRETGRPDRDMAFEDVCREAPRSARRGPALRWGTRRPQPGRRALRGALTRWDVTGMLKRKPWMKNSDGMSRMDFGPNIC